MGPSDLDWDIATEQFSGIADTRPNSLKLHGVGYCIISNLAEPQANEPTSAACNLDNFPAKHAPALIISDKSHETGRLNCILCVV